MVGVAIVPIGAEALDATVQLDPAAREALEGLAPA
jgi:hypothetical protein